MLYSCACCAVSPAFFESEMLVGIGVWILDYGFIGFAELIGMYGFVGILLIFITVIMCCVVICDLLSLFPLNYVISH